MANKVKQVLREVANPTPPILMVFNPSKGAKTMARKAAAQKPAAKKKASSSSARKPKTTTRSASVREASTTANKHAPKRKPKMKNPLIVYRTKPNSAGSDSSEVINFSVGGLAVGVVRPLIQPIVGRFIPAQFVLPASTAIAGWGLAKGFEYFRVTKRFARAAKLVGYSTAVIALTAPFIQRWLSPMMSQAAPQTGMSGFGLMPRIPQIAGQLAAATGAAAVQQGKQARQTGGMSGFAVTHRPGR